MDYTNTMWTLNHNYFCVKLYANMFAVFLLFHSDAWLNVAWLIVAKVNCRPVNCRRLTVT